MQAHRKSDARRLIGFALAIGVASAASSAWAVPNADDAQAHEAWKQAIVSTPAPAEGCFHTVYPSTRWVQDACNDTPHRYMPVPRNIGAQAGSSQTVGNGEDDALESSKLISQIVGTFPTVTGVTSEKSVAVPAFGSGGILGKNEYTLEIGSGIDLPSAACKNHTGCTIYQSFVYSTDFAAKGTAALYIEYMLIDWGTAACPTGWDSFGPGDCAINSSSVALPDEPISQLQDEKLSASATAAGNDTLVFADGTKAWSVSAKDSVLKLASVWKQAEFNVFGDNGGSRADFNKGSSVTVKISAVDGSTAAPTCLKSGGSNGGTNNLTLGNCAAVGGATPYIEFTESN